MPLLSSILAFLKVLRDGPSHLQFYNLLDPSLEEKKASSMKFPYKSRHFLTGLLGSFWLQGKCDDDWPEEPLSLL